MDEMLSYSEALPLLLDLMQRRVAVVISTHAEEGNWAAIAFLIGRLKRADAEDLVEAGAPPHHFPGGESTTLLLDTGSPEAAEDASAFITVSERNCHGAQVDPDGRLFFYLGRSLVLIAPQEEDDSTE
jgi:hypothetical protein